MPTAYMNVETIVVESKIVVPAPGLPERPPERPERLAHFLHKMNPFTTLGTEMCALLRQNRAFPEHSSALRGSVLAGTCIPGLLQRSEARVSSTDQTPTDQDSMLWTLEEIGRLVSQSGDPAETLNNLVHLIKQRFETDVCSVYLLEADRASLVLAATVGLRPEGVGRVRMRAHGRAGRARRRAAAAAGRRRRARRHPRFKYFQEAGEDPYRSRSSACRSSTAGCCWACSSFRRSSARTFSQDDVRMLVMAGSQLAPIVSEARALGQSVAPAHQRLSALARNLWWSWDNDTTASSASWNRSCGASSITTRLRSCSRSPIETLEERAQQLLLHSRINYAYRRMQEYLKSRSHVGRAPRRRAVGAAGRLLLRRVRAPRIAADLLGRPRHPRRRSHQERIRPRDPAGRRRALLRPGLLQAAARSGRPAARGLPRRGQRAAARSSRPPETACRSRSRSRRARAPSPRGCGRWPSGATRCCCSTRTSRATCRRTAS